MCMLGVHLYMCVVCNHTSTCTRYIRMYVVFLAASDVVWRKVGEAEQSEILSRHHSDRVGTLRVKRGLLWGFPSVVKLPHVEIFVTF